MADNTQLGTPVGTGDVIASDDIAGVKHQRVKVEFGTDGSATDVSTANPLPVVQTGTPALPTGAATLSEQQSQTTSLQLIDDAVKTDDAVFTPATDKVLMIGAEADETTPDAVDEGDAGALRMTLQRGLHANLRNASGTEIGTAAAPVRTDPTGSTTQPVSAATLPLPSGAATEAKQDTQITHEAAIRTAVEIMDDWDETDRAKVNPIVGQAGVAAGAGAVGVTTQRTTLASDDPAVTALQVMDDWDESDRAKVNPIVGQAGITGGAGAVAANTPRVTHASDDPAVTALQLIDNPVKVDDAAFTPATDSVMMAGAMVDDDTSDVADEGDAVALRATKERKLRVVAALDSAAMQSGNDEVTPKFAVIDAATSGDNTLVAAVSSKKIRVLALFLVAAGTVTARFESGAGGTALTGQMNLVANSGFVLPFNPVGWFETAATTLLNLELSGAISVDGSLTYIEVD